MPRRSSSPGRVAAATGLVLALLCVHGPAGAAAQTTTFPLLGGALRGTNLTALATQYTDPISQLFQHALSQASSSTATGSASASNLVSSVATNFQAVVKQQADYYKNLETNLAQNNSTFAKEAVCDLGTTYQSLPSLAGGSSTLSTLLSSSNYLTTFNKECQNIANPGKSPLVNAVQGLASNSTLAQQVETLVSKMDSTSGTTTASRVPAYLQSTTIGKLLQGLSTTSSSPTSQNIISQLYTNLLASLGGSSAATPASNGALAQAFLQAVQGTASTLKAPASTTPPSSTMLNQIENLMQSYGGSGK